MMQLMTRLLAVMLLCTGLAMTGCSKDNSAEEAGKEAGKKVDKALDSAKGAFKDLTK